jgi:MFS family permease
LHVFGSFSLDTTFPKHPKIKPHIVGQAFYSFGAEVIIMKVTNSQKGQQIVFILIGIALLIHGIVQIHTYYTEIKELEEISDKIPFQKGMSFTTWSNFSYNTSWVREEFDKMKAIGVEWVAINHWWWQDYLNSTEIKQGPWSDGFANMTDCFLYAKSIGLHIMYKPMLNLLKTYDWRSYIIYTDEWMKNYTAWLVENAKAAEAGGVEILCFGTEMGNMQVHSDGVREMIRQIREVFSGLLTYSANHDSFKFVDWYDAIDIIGISMYSMMTTAWDPTVQELTTVWNGMYQDLLELALRWKKPIAFTEIGIQAMDGSNMIPNDNQISQEKDVSEMENFYLSLFNSKIWTAFWFKGAYWWIWDRAQAGDSNLKSFNPVIIQDTIKAEYEKDHVVVASDSILIQTSIPLVCGLFVFSILILKVKNIQIPEKKKQIKVELSQPDAMKFDKNPANASNSIDITIGLVLGVFIATIWTLLTLGLYNFIHKSFSYAVILQISLINTILVFLGLLFLTLFLGLALSRFLPRHILSFSAIMLLFSPYFALNSASQSIFINLFFDLLVVFMVAGAFMLIMQRTHPQKILPIIATMIVVLTVYFIAILFFERLTNVFLAIPLCFAIYLSSKSNPSNLHLQTIQDIENTQNDTIPRVKMLMLIAAFLSGILIPFGNSNINLISMNYLSITQYYLPALIGSTVLVCIYFILRRLRPDFDERRFANWFQLDRFIMIALILGGLGILFIMIGKPIGIWAIISGLTLIIFMGVLVFTSNSSFSPQRLARNYIYLFLVAILFVLGFILNGIKGLFVVTLTFLIFKDGQILRRDPMVDPVPAFDVPMILDGIIIAVVILVSILALLYILLRNRIKCKTQKAAP